MQHINVYIVKGIYYLLFFRNQTRTTLRGRMSILPIYLLCLTPPTRIWLVMLEELQPISAFSSGELQLTGVKYMCMLNNKYCGTFYVLVVASSGYEPTSCTTLQLIIVPIIWRQPLHVLLKLTNQRNLYQIVGCKYLSWNNLTWLRLIRGKLFPDRYLLPIVVY